MIAGVPRKLQIQMSEMLNSLFSSWKMRLPPPWFCAVDQFVMCFFDKHPNSVMSMIKQFFTYPFCKFIFEGTYSSIVGRVLQQK